MAIHRRITLYPYRRKNGWKPTRGRRRLQMSEDLYENNSYEVLKRTAGDRNAWRESTRKEEPSTCCTVDNRKRLTDYWGHLLSMDLWIGNFPNQSLRFEFESWIETGCSHLHVQCRLPQELCRPTVYYWELPYCMLRCNVIVNVNDSIWTKISNSQVPNINIK